MARSLSYGTRAEKQARGRRRAKSACGCLRGGVEQTIGCAASGSGKRSGLMMAVWELSAAASGGGLESAERTQRGTAGDPQRDRPRTSQKRPRERGVVEAKGRTLLGGDSPQGQMLHGHLSPV